MAPERVELMQAVLRGEISDEYVTMEDIQAFELVLMDAIIAKRFETNPAVFSGFDTVQ